VQVLKDDLQPEISRSSTPLPSAAADVGSLASKYRPPARQEPLLKRYKNLDEFLEESDDSGENEEKEADESSEESQFGHTDVAK